MRARMHGFTLVELMAALAVLGLLVGFAVPAFAGLVRWMDAVTTSHQLTGSLMIARSVAITRGEPVSVCPSRDGLICLSADAWTGGWIVFRDPKRAGKPLNGADVLNRIERSSSLLISSNSGRPLIRYQPDGRSPGANATFSICSNSQRLLLMQVVVNNAGRVRAARIDRPVACNA